MDYTKQILVKIIPILFIGCTSHKISDSDLSYIKSKTWQYDTGFKVGEGDFLHFDVMREIIDLRHDTIFFKGNPKGIIQKLEKKQEEIIIIVSLDGKETAEYVNIEAFSKQ